MDMPGKTMPSPPAQIPARIPRPKSWHAFCLINLGHGHVITPPQVASRAVPSALFFRPSGHRARIAAKTSHSRRAASRDRVDSAMEKRIIPLANRPGMHHTGARDALFQRAKGADRGIGKPNRMAQEMLDYW